MMEQREVFITIRKETGASPLDKSAADTCILLLIF